MLASVIIVTKNQLPKLQQIIPILLQQKVKGLFEIIVVDSGSTDGARSYIKRIKSKRVRLVEISPNNFNYSKAFNAGANHASGKYLIRLSGDCIPVKTSWLAEIIKPFSDLKVGGTYGRYIVTGRKGFTYPDYWPAERFPNVVTRYSVTPTFLMGVSIFGLQPGDRKTSERVFNFTGGSCAIRKNIWKQRPFNESLLAAEDAEYSWFLHIVGYDVVYNPKAEVIHEHRFNPIKTAGNYLGISLWQWVFNWQITKYWLKRILFGDPYGRMKQSLLHL